MTRTNRVATIAAAMGLSLHAAAVVAGDAREGEQVFQRENCVQCHSVNGKGGNSAPDLGRRVGRDFTPAQMASLMWNHAPSMWSAMSAKGVRLSTLDEQSASNLFTYFYSTRFFELPGDAARGKRLFSEKHCAGCHGTTQAAGAGKPIKEWTLVGYPIALAQRMWNHASQMQDLFRQKGLKWVQLTPQELTDIQVYVQSLPETRSAQPNMILPAGDEGQKLFEQKGCVKCHTGKLALETRLKNLTMTGIAVEMWNHAPRMIQPPPALELDEMRQIVAYLWARQFYAGEGNSGRGKRVFEQKRCSVCHNDPASGAPNLSASKGQYSAPRMVSVLWRHGPRMLERMKERGIQWPRFDRTQMADLIAYLNQ